MVVFAPWAFGATQSWAIWTMNGAGYLLGIVLVAKRGLRWRTGYRPPRWGEPVPAPGVAASFRPHTRAARWLTRSLAALNAIVLVYTLVAALNHRAEIRSGVQEFNEHYVQWLPFSYDASSTWGTFWLYLALTGCFWATRDWLLGKTPLESGYEDPTYTQFLVAQRAGLPERLSRLLWLLCLNATVLGVVGILQRLEGTEKLLWLVQPRYGNAGFHFGPFTYRGNAAQYFNLLWPVSLAFWWTLFRASQNLQRVPVRVGDHPHWLLLPCVLIQIACPIISASHGGGVVALGLATGALGVLMVANWRASLAVRLGTLAPFVLAVSLAGYLGWNQYQAGLVNAFADDLGDRVEIYNNARLIAVDHPMFGTGPGTFADVYSLYRSRVAAAYAHNDWLETQITFGWIGLAVVLAMLVHPFVRWWIRDGIECRWDLIAMIWLALAGCLFHARFDFPFQIYALLHLFLMLCCIGCCVARKA